MSIPAPPDLSAAALSTFDEASALVLDYLQAQVPMGFWTVSRVIGGRQVYLSVTPNEFGLGVGDGPRWEDAVCRAMWEDGGPRVAPDISRVPEYAANEAALGLRLGSYVGVPILNADRSLFGTVCGMDVDTRAASFVELGPQLELLGQLLSVVRNVDDQAIALTRRLEVSLEDAETDELTGLRNRRGWHRICETEEARHHRLGDLAGVIVLDLDGLKQVNDRDGHAAGDALLRRAANVITQTAREGDIVARLGGDEFGVLCPQTDPGGVAALGDRVREGLTAQGLSAGIGVATLDRSTTMADTVARADAAMYTDKRSRTAGR
ncbi:GGDEF domain-containing protein [Microbacterium sp. bgisy189]|uniref:GGDEF domain-containing protein n=1 Tax=Microbacterium sp. bgisy189 TaxID=3413798 RepID=UPI003EBB3BA5